MNNIDKQKKLAQLVEEKAKVVNITAIRDYDSILQKHIYDSLEIKNSEVWSDLIKNGNKLLVLDLGTGGGFPGLPLAIEYPEYTFTLIDSTRKKIDAVSEFSRVLELKNVNPIWARSEELVKNPKYKNSFDVVVSRAVAYLPTLIEMSKDFIKPGGVLAFYKNFSEQELEEGKAKALSLNLTVMDSHDYKFEESNRTILFYKN